MKKVHDRSKKRRNFVVLMWIYGAMLTFILASVVFLCSVMLIGLKQRLTFENLLSAGESVGVVTVLLLFCAWILQKEARTVPYVPPMREQIAQAPPEETLLRGSDAPAAAPEELLRPAQSGAEDLAKNLLRPSQEG